MATRLDFLCIPLRLGGGVFVLTRLCRNFLFLIVVSLLFHTNVGHVKCELNKFILCDMSAFEHEYSQVCF